MTKLKEDTINIDSVDCFESEVSCGDSVMNIHWSCNLGFGSYTLVFKTNGTIEAYSECMDSDDDKTFLRALFNKIADITEVYE